MILYNGDPIQPSDIAAMYYAHGTKGMWYVLELKDGSAVEIDTVAGSINIDDPGEDLGGDDYDDFQAWLEWVDENWDFLPDHDADPLLYGWDSLEDLYKHVGAEWNLEQLRRTGGGNV